jgi:excisionase family DNA binding protein
MTGCLCSDYSHLSSRDAPRLTAAHDDAAYDAAMTERLLRKPEVAALLRVSIRTVDRLIASRQLPCVRLGEAGGAVRFRIDDVNRLVERSREAAP